MGATQSVDLLAAAERGDAVRLAALLEGDAGTALPPLDATDENDRTALVLIVRAELSADAKAHWVKQLTALGADVNRRDRREWTVLHHAAERGTCPGPACAQRAPLSAPRRG